ncbi:MAG: HAD-IA family hydrolase [bacterium]|nr:HAD-IA family hydrolase [bacterium]
MSIKLVIFDLDGTLIDSLKDITAALNHATAPYGIEEKSVRGMGDLLGTGISILIDRVLGDERGRLKEEVLARFMDYYAAHLVVFTSVYPGVRETLDRLGRYKKAVITNKREQFAKIALNELGIGSYFDSILGSDSVAEKKPSPLPVLHLLDLYKLNPSDAVMVGDSEIDIAAGKGAGVRTVAVTYGYRERDALEGADFIIDDIGELAGVIEGI